jgi:hypothetical protein
VPIERAAAPAQARVAIDGGKPERVPAERALASGPNAEDCGREDLSASGDASHAAAITLGGLMRPGRIKTPYCASSTLRSRAAHREEDHVGLPEIGSQSVHPSDQAGVLIEPIRRQVRECTGVDTCDV